MFLKIDRVIITAIWAILAASSVNAAEQRGNTEGLTGNYSFRLEIDGVDAGQFTSVEGLSIEQEVIEYQNGDDPLTRKRPGRVKYGDITLKRGYVASSILNDWIEQARLGNGEYTRKNVSVIVVDSQDSELKRFNLFACFPVSWKLSPLDADDPRSQLMETLVIAVEWFEEA